MLQPECQVLRHRNAFCEFVICSYAKSVYKLCVSKAFYIGRFEGMTARMTLTLISCWVTWDALTWARFEVESRENLAQNVNPCFCFRVYRATRCVHCTVFVNFSSWPHWKWLMPNKFGPNFIPSSPPEIVSE